MKKIIPVLSTFIYLVVLMVLRKYPENHIYSFLTGIFCALTVVFFMYMIDKKQNLKNK